MRKFCFLILFLTTFLIIDFWLPKVFPTGNKEGYLLGFENFLTSARDSVGQERIILVGGSSLGWGVSAKQLGESLNVLILNSGIHAGVGYRNFFRNISDVINKEHDLIVISPEYSIVSEGGDFGRSPEFCEISIYVRNVWPVDCVGYTIANFAKILPVLNIFKNHSANNEYIRSGFNELGDYVHRIPRYNNQKEISSIDRCVGWNLADLTNKYIPFMKNLRDDGFEIVYIPNFIPVSACSDVNQIEIFHKILFDEFGIRPFFKPKLLFDDSYFYNTAYHLTKEGVAVKTKIFEDHLLSYFNNKIGK